MVIRKQRISACIHPEKNRGSIDLTIPLSYNLYSHYNFRGEKMTNTESKSPLYLVIAIMMIGLFVSMLNETMLNIALPTITEDLGITYTESQWLRTGYMLVNAILIPSTAFLIQKYSTRGLFLTAMTTFTLGTFLAANANSFEFLMGARILQATGAAIMMPLMMNYMMVSFPPQKRGKAMGIFGIAFMLAPAIGPTLAGWLLETHDWRSMFQVVLPISIAVLVLAFFLLKDDKKTTNIKLDFLSLIISSFAFGGLLYGFSAVGSNTTDNPWLEADVVIPVLVGVLALILLIVRQSKQKNPMLNFGVYKHPLYAISSGVMFFNAMAMFAAIMLLPIFAQSILGMTPFESGLLMLPGALIMGVMNPITGILYDKIGPRIPVVTGLIIVIVSSYGFTEITVETTNTTIVILNTVRMMGLGLVMMPVQTNGLNALPKEFYPHGSAMNSTMMQVAGALGSALIVSTMTARTEAHATELADEAMKTVTPDMSADAIAGLQAQVAMEAAVKGINDAFMLTVIFVLIALMLSFFMKRAYIPEKRKDN